MSTETTAGTESSKATTGDRAPISAGSSGIGKPLCIYDKGGNALALMSDRIPNKERIALDIVRAVNAHDDLTAFTQGVTDEFGFAEWATPEQAEQILQDMIKRWHPRGRAALAKAVRS